MAQYILPPATHVRKQPKDKLYISRENIKCGSKQAVTQAGLQGKGKSDMGRKLRVFMFSISSEDGNLEFIHRWSSLIKRCGHWLIQISLLSYPFSLYLSCIQKLLSGSDIHYNELSKQYQEWEQKPMRQTVKPPTAI